AHQRQREREIENQLTRDIARLAVIGSVFSIRSGVVKAGALVGLVSVICGCIGWAAVCGEPVRPTAIVHTSAAAAITPVATTRLYARLVSRSAIGGRALLRVAR